MLKEIKFVTLGEFPSEVKYLRTSLPEQSNTSDSKSQKKSFKHPSCQHEVWRELFLNDKQYVFDQEIISDTVSHSRLYRFTAATDGLPREIVLKERVLTLDDQAFDSDAPVYREAACLFASAYPQKGIAYGRVLNPARFEKVDVMILPGLGMDLAYLLESDASKTEGLIKKMLEAYYTIKLAHPDFVHGNIHLSNIMFSEDEIFFVGASGEKHKDPMTDFRQLMDICKKARVIVPGKLVKDIEELCQTKPAADHKHSSQVGLFIKPKPVSQQDYLLDILCKKIAEEKNRLQVARVEQDRIAQAYSRVKRELKRQWTLIGGEDDGRYPILTARMTLLALLGDSLRLAGQRPMQDPETFPALKEPLSERTREIEACLQDYCRVYYSQPEISLSPRQLKFLVSIELEIKKLEDDPARDPASEGVAIQIGYLRQLMRHVREQKPFGRFILLVDPQHKVFFQEFEDIQKLPEFKQPRQALRKPATRDEHKKIILELRAPEQQRQQQDKFLDQLKIAVEADAWQADPKVSTLPQPPAAAAEFFRDFGAVIERVVTGRERVKLLKDFRSTLQKEIDQLSEWNQALESKDIRHQINYLSKLMAMDGLKDWVSTFKPEGIRVSSEFDTETVGGIQPTGPRWLYLRPIEMTPYHGLFFNRYQNIVTAATLGDEEQQEAFYTAAKSLQAKIVAEIKKLKAMPGAAHKIEYLSELVITISQEKISFVEWSGISVEHQTFFKNYDALLRQKQSGLVGSRPAVPAQFEQLQQWFQSRKQQLRVKIFEQCRQSLKYDFLQSLPKPLKHLLNALEAASIFKAVPLLEDKSNKLLHKEYYLLLLEKDIRYKIIALTEDEENLTWGPDKIYLQPDRMKGRQYDRNSAGKDFLRRLLAVVEKQRPEEPAQEVVSRDNICISPEFLHFYTSYQQILADTSPSLEQRVYSALSSFS